MVMRTFYLFFLLIFISPISYSQMIFFENFDLPACPGGSGCDPSLSGWTVSQSGFNGITPNRWYISGKSSGQPGDCDAWSTTDQTLHIANDSNSSAAQLMCPTGDCGAAYDASDSSEITDVRVESPVIDLTGKTNVLLSFHYIENGDTTNDNAEVWYFDGTAWNFLEDIYKTNDCGAWNGLWTSHSVLLPVSANNNPGVKIGFRWYNNGDGIGTDPSVSINDVSLLNNFNNIVNNDLPKPEIIVINNVINFTNCFGLFIEITDVTGRIIHVQKNDSPVSIFIGGIYFIRISNSKFSVTNKVFVD